MSENRKRRPSLVQTSLSFQPNKRSKVDVKSCGKQPLSTMSRGVQQINPSSSLRSKSLSSNKKVQPKKLVIKNFVAPVVTSTQLDELWTRLQHGLSDILQTGDTRNKSSLLDDADNLCIHGDQMELYRKIEQEVKRHMECCSKEFALKQFPNNTAFLRELADIWGKHSKQTYLIRNIFNYLERRYVMLSHKQLLPLWEMGAATFRRELMCVNNVSNKCVEGMLSLIEQERCGDDVDGGLLNEIVSMLRKLNMYSSDFEGPFLVQTNEFYRVKGDIQLNDSSVPVYLIYVTKCLADEERRLRHYLGSSSRKQLIKTVESNLIGSHVKSLLEKGFDSMMDEKRYSDLQVLYTLLNRVSEGAYRMCFFLYTYIKNRGLEVVMNPEKDKTMVQELLEFKDTIDSIIKQSFNKEDCVEVKKKAFEEFINMRPNKPAELIAKFIDSKLRSGNKEQTEEELEELLDKVMVLFRFIHGKDIFEAFYKKDLAKRLLMSKSASIDSEKSMLGKLKRECGSQFTFKLEGMFKDMAVSKDLMLSYKERESEGGVDLSVTVLTTGYWPSYPADSVIIPAQISGVLDKYKTYYLNKHSGRKLTWQHSLSFCTLKATFGDDSSSERKIDLRKELNVSVYQGLVLFLFNNSNRLSYSTIAESTAIEEEELGRVLQSLACGKTRVLKKHPPGKDINKTDNFEFNADFRHKLFKFKINQIQTKETAEENVNTTEKVFQDRQYQIDAAVVRIMKARKTMQHSLLVSELYNQLKFPVKPVDIKKRIESLIERDYVERSKEDKNVYHYVA
ncbi:hypothetical protein ACHWQZ_G019191 [Mnemiopsis leidyi]